MSTKEITAAYLNLSPEERNRQDRLRDCRLQWIEPVITPAAHAMPEDHPHLGWPVATRAGGAIIVAFNAGGGDESGTGIAQPNRGRMIIRSLDDGETWTAPVYVADLVQHPETTGPGMCALGTTLKDRAVLLERHGLFISDDGGETWEHVDAKGLPEGNAGPTLIDHPRFGWIFCACSRGGPTFFVSHDEGKTWKTFCTEWRKEKEKPGFSGFVSEFDLDHVPTGPFAPAEPTVFGWDEHFAVVSRNHSGPRTKDYMKTWCHFAQFVAGNAQSARQFEDLSFTGDWTNMFARRMDTMDVIYNPVTRRIEAVTPKRNEGFPRRDDRRQALVLWSMDPQDFLKGHATWRFECVLVRSEQTWSRGGHPDFPPREGMHPAGSVVDPENRLQHIFAFFGDRNHAPPRLGTGKTGVFRITRSLDTPALVRKARELDRFGEISGLREDFSSLEAWTPSGRPVGLAPTEDKDVMERKTAPLPAGKIEAGPQGLLIRTAAAGYYGIHHEQAIVTSEYRLEFKARVVRYPQHGDALGIGIHYGARKQHLILRRDGLYHRVKPQGPELRKDEIDMDTDWHVWKIEMNEGIARVFIDGKPVTTLGDLVDDRLGEDDAPVNLYVRTTDAGDPAEVQMAYLSIENINV